MKNIVINYIDNNWVVYLKDSPQIKAKSTIGFDDAIGYLLRLYPSVFQVHFEVPEPEKIQEGYRHQREKGV
jgi:hypothetical protein